MTYPHQSYHPVTAATARYRHANRDHIARHPRPIWSDTEWCWRAENSHSVNG